MPPQAKKFDAAARQCLVALLCGGTMFVTGCALYGAGQSVLWAWGGVITLAAFGAVGTIVLAGLLSEAGDSFEQLQTKLLRSQATETREHVREAFSEAGDLVEQAFRDFAPAEWWEELARWDEDQEESMFPMPDLDPELREGLDEGRAKERRGVGLDMGREEAAGVPQPQRRIVIVLMPPASARDSLAVIAEASGSISIVADAELVIGLWPQDMRAIIGKYRHVAPGQVEVTVVSARTQS